MPLRGITIFASQKGGTGKTFLSVQCASTHAEANPSEHVLFIDMTELGDGTKRLLGGQEFMEGKENTLGGLFGLASKAMEVEEAKEKDQQRGLLSKLFFRGSEKPVFQIDDHARHVYTTSGTGNVPKNVYVISSGGQTIEEDEVEEASGMYSHDDRYVIVEALRKSMADSDKTWRVFIDTDGDRRPSVLTRLGYLLADFCVVPLQPDACDFQRVEQMLGTLQDLRSKGEANCQVELVLWNKVQLVKGDPSEVGHFTTTKACIDTLKYLNAKLADMKKATPDLFTPDFCTVLVKDFPDTIAQPASACGLAFCCMKTGKVTTRGGVTFAVEEKGLTSCKESVDRIVEKMSTDPLR